jgi:hypothetical protein
MNKTSNELAIIDLLTTIDSLIYSKYSNIYKKLKGLLLCRLYLSIDDFRIHLVPGYKYLYSNIIR